MFLQMLVVSGCVLRSSPRARHRHHHHEQRRLRARHAATSRRGTKEAHPGAPHEHRGTPPAGGKYHGATRTDVGLRLLRRRRSECGVQLPVCGVQFAAGVVHLRILLRHARGREASVGGCV